MTEKKTKPAKKTKRGGQRDNAGRKPGSTNKNPPAQVTVVNLRVPNPYHERLSARAEANGHSLNKEGVALLLWAIENHPS